MTNLKKLLVATAAVAALSAGSAHAIVTTNSAEGTSFIASSTAPTSALAISGGQLQVDNAVMSGTAAGTNFAALFAAGNTMTVSLSQGTFSGIPTVVQAQTCGGTNATAPAVVTGSGTGTLSFAFASGSDVGCVTISSISVAGVTNSASGANITATVGSPQTVLANVPTEQLTQRLVRFRNPIAVTTGVPTLISQGSTAGTTNLILNDTATGFGSGGTLANLTFTYTTVRNFDGTTVTLGAPTFTGQLPGYNPGSISQVVLTANTTTGTTTNCLAANQTVTSIPTSGTIAFSSGTSASSFCSVTLALTAGAKGTISTGPVSIASSWPITTNTPGAATTFTSSSIIGGIAPALGTQEFLVPYVVGSDTLYGWFLNVAVPSNQASGAVRVAVGPYSAVLSAAQARGSQALYSIETIRTALLAQGAPSTTFADAAQRGQLVVTAPTGSKVNPLILNKSTGLVTEVGGGTVAAIP